MIGWSFARASALLLLLAGAAAAGGYKCNDPEYRDSFACREVIVEHGTGFAAAPFADTFGLELIGSIPELGETWFQAAQGTDLKVLLKSIKAWSKTYPAADVHDAEVNGRYLSDDCRQHNVSVLEILPDEMDLVTRQPALHAMHARPVSSRGVGVTVAVLDTGVSRSHPALKGALVTPGIDLVHGTNLADDVGDGQDDPEDPDGSVDTGWGHGTAVAGLIHLVAPGARILPVRVADDECHGSAYALAAGVIRAVEAGARVVNISLGAHESSLSVSRATQWAAQRGALVVAPSGNADPADKLTFGFLYPAREKNVMAVAAVDSSLVAPGWAVAGSRVALVAPGVAVIAPYRDAYARLDGSSFSTALVSGAASVALAADPDLTREELWKRLTSCARSVDNKNRDLRHKLGAGVPDVDELAGSRD